MSVRIGPFEVSRPVLLAPMSGISDLPFRRAVARAGAGMVVSEMVASEELVRARPDVVLRAAVDRGGEVGPNVIQLAGREAKWMAEGAVVAEAAGADIIDINMGCPARQVTGALSGSALMRDLDHAMTLIEAVVGNTSCPVTLKMRLGWDHDSLNAPELARRAEAAGVALVTVHGRTRQQFYTGIADWDAIAPVKRAVSIPVIANGDIVDADTARAALRSSGADGVMIGRAAEGRPWLVGAVAQALSDDAAMIEPPAEAQARMLIDLYRETIAHYEHGHGQDAARGRRIGIRSARKHLASFVDHLRLPLDEDDRRAWRGALCRATDPDDVVSLIRRVSAAEPPPQVARA